MNLHENFDEGIGMLAAILGFPDLKANLRAAWEVCCSVSGGSYTSYVLGSKSPYLSAHARTGGHVIVYVFSGNKPVMGLLMDGRETELKITHIGISPALSTAPKVMDDPIELQNAVVALTKYKVLYRVLVLNPETNCIEWVGGNIS